MNVNGRSGMITVGTTGQICARRSTRSITVSNSTGKFQNVLMTIAQSTPKSCPTNVGLSGNDLVTSVGLTASIQKHLTSGLTTAICSISLTRHGAFGMRSTTWPISSSYSASTTRSGTRPEKQSLSLIRPPRMLMSGANTALSEDSALARLPVPSVPLEPTSLSMHTNARVLPMTSQDSEQTNLQN